MFIDSRPAGPSMEIRKIQTTAAGTFIITIPKEWAEKLEMRKGDNVSVDLEEGNIIVTPMGPRPEVLSGPLDIGQFESQRALELRITASYIQGHDVTEIASKETMKAEQKRWIRQTVEGLIGVEVAEDYAKKVVLQNLVDPTKFDLDRLIGRFSSVSTAIYQDAVRALVEKDPTLAQDAFMRGNESTKLYRLLMRLAIQASNDKTLRAKMEIPNVSGVIVRIIAVRELERISYYAMRIAEHVSNLGRKVPEKVVSMIEKMGRLDSEMQGEAISALIARELEGTSQLSDKMGKVRTLYEAAHAEVMKVEEFETSLALTLITRDLRGIASFAVTLADDAVLASFY